MAPSPEIPRPARTDPAPANELEPLLLPGPETRTPEFKAWFDGSVVRLEDGRPRPLVHGTHEVLGQFQPGRSSLVFLTDSVGYARSYGPNLHKVYVNARKVADLDNDPVARELAIKNFNESNFRNEDDGFEPVFDPANDETWELTESPTFVEAMTAAGYDAACFREGAADGRDMGTTFAVFSPAQVRIAATSKR